MKSRIGRLALLVLALTLVLALVPLTAWAQGTIVSISPATATVDVNQTVSVDIKVDTVTNLYGVDVRLTFDTTKLEAQDGDGNSANGISVAPGAFLNAAQGFLAQNEISNTTGQVKYVFALMAPAPAVSGSGVVARITFKAKAAGAAAITLNSVTLSNDQAQPIAATLMNGSITVVGTGTSPTATPVPGVTPTAVPTTTPGGQGFPYVVQWGDTLYSIARKYNVTAQALITANNLTNPNLIRAGQVLIIPTLPAPGPGPSTYVVQAGDNLYRISLKFGVSVEAIVAVNHIVNPWLIRAGQVLTIPTGSTPVPPAAKTYTVQLGDTVWGIAAKFQVTPWSIIMLNNLANPNLIYVGQVLNIP